MGTEGHGQCHHLIERYDFLSYFNRDYASIFYRFRDIACYLSKVADFDPPHLHLAPPLGFNPVEFRGDLWRQKTRQSYLLLLGIPSPTHFHSRLKTFLFCKSFPPHPFFFFFRIHYMDSPDCLLLFLSIPVSVFYF